MRAWLLSNNIRAKSRRVSTKCWLLLFSQEGFAGSSPRVLSCLAENDDREGRLLQAEAGEGRLILTSTKGL